jgi:hypothetical protein
MSIGNPVIDSLGNVIINNASNIYSQSTLNAPTMDSQGGLNINSYLYSNNFGNTGIIVNNNGDIFVGQTLYAGQPNPSTSVGVINNTGGITINTLLYGSNSPVPMLDSYGSLNIPSGATSQFQNLPADSNYNIVTIDPSGILYQSSSSVATFGPTGAYGTLQFNNSGMLDGNTSLFWDGGALNISGVPYAINNGGLNIENYATIQTSGNVVIDSQGNIILNNGSFMYPQSFLNPPILDSQGGLNISSNLYNNTSGITGIIADNNGNIFLGQGLYAGQPSPATNNLVINNTGGINVNNFLYGNGGIPILDANGSPTVPVGATAVFQNLVSDSTLGSATNVVTIDPSSSVLYYSTSKTFVIDHPTNTNKYLVHGCLEGPEAGVYYRGSGFIDNESVCITLPNYVDKIANNFTISLTSIGKNAQLWSTEVINNQFTVYSNISTKFHYHVYGTRLEIDTEPSKTDFTTKGEGPYTWLESTK